MSGLRQWPRIAPTSPKRSARTFEGVQSAQEWRFAGAQPNFSTSLRDYVELSRIKTRIDTAQSSIARQQEVNAAIRVPHVQSITFLGETGFLKLDWFILSRNQLTARAKTHTYLNWSNGSYAQKKTRKKTRTGAVATTQTPWIWLTSSIDQKLILGGHR